MAKINFVNKQDLVISGFSQVNKVTATDINTIKQVVNENDNILSTKTEKGGFAGTSQDLKNAIDTAVFDGAKTYQTEAELLAVSPIPANGTPAKVANNVSDPTKNGNWSVVSGAWVQDASVVSNIANSVDIKTVGDELQLSDRDKTTNSLGYKYIRSNFDFTAIPAGYDNSKWEIRDFFDLEGGTITMPENAELIFNGGKIQNAIIVGNKTKIKSDLVQIFGTGNTFSGTFVLENVSPVWFGAVGDGITDNTIAFQNAIDFASLNKCPVVIPIGKFGITASLELSQNVELKGVSKYGSVLYALTDNFIMLTRFNTATSFDDDYVGLSNFTVWGYADRNTTQNNDYRLIRIGNAGRVIVKDMYLKHSRQMGLTAGGGICIVENCELEYILRDGINLSDARQVIVTNNIGKYIEDDFIACHVGASTTTVGAVNEPSIISNNYGFSCQGIAVLGARNTVIEGNSLEFVKARGIVFGVDTASSEGLVDTLNVVIKNNTIKDIINVQLSNDIPARPNVANGIQVVFTSNTNGGGVTVVPTAQLNPATGEFVLPDTYWNEFGASTTRPSGANLGIVIEGNTLIQTLGGLTNLSDAGYGELWTRTGFFDPATKGNIYFSGESVMESSTIYHSVGISIASSVRGLNISNNYVGGFRRSISFDTNIVRDNVKILNNTFQRCRNGIIFSGSSDYTVDVQISGNTFDNDPYLEALDRSLSAWTSLSDGNSSAISAIYVQGLKISNNIFKNCKDILHKTASTSYFLSNNFYVCDPVNARGIGVLLEQNNNTILWSDLDTTSSTYGNVISRGLTESATIPTSGYFTKGVFVKNSNQIVSGARIISGWLRLTNGNAHVSGTDWQIVHHLLTPLSATNNVLPASDNAWQSGSPTFRWSQVNSVRVLPNILKSPDASLIDVRTSSETSLFKIGGSNTTPTAPDGINTEIRITDDGFYYKSPTLGWLKATFTTI
jgi:hypothetical protein